MWGDTDENTNRIPADRYCEQKERKKNLAKCVKKDFFRFTKKTKKKLSLFCLFDYSRFTIKHLSLNLASPCCPDFLDFFERYVLLPIIAFVMCFFFLSRLFHSPSRTKHLFQVPFCCLPFFLSFFFSSSYFRAFRSPFTHVFQPSHVLTLCSIST